jgi:hypothetical protein
MKFSALIAVTGAISPVLAIPQYLSSREFVPQKWIAPAEGACEFPKYNCTLHMLTVW